MLKEQEDSVGFCGLFCWWWEGCSDEGLGKVAELVRAGRKFQTCGARLRTWVQVHGGSDPTTAASLSL